MENIKEYFILKDWQLFLWSKGDIKEKDNIIYWWEYETNNICLIDKDKNVVRALVKKCLAKMGLDVDSKMIKMILMFQLVIIFWICFISYLIMSKTSNIVWIIENWSKDSLIKKDIVNFNDKNKIYIDKESAENPEIKINQIIDDTLNFNK